MRNLPAGRVPRPVVAPRNEPVEWTSAVRGFELPFLSIVILVFQICCVLDVARTDTDAVRILPRPVWLVAIILLPVIGGLGWLLVGRPGSGTVTVTSPPPALPRQDSARLNHPSRGRRERSRPQAPRGPDDDPEFLSELEERLRRRDEPDER